MDPRVAALLDVGAQRPIEWTQGSDNGRCVRCQLLPATAPSAWCDPCRVAVAAGIEGAPGASGRAFEFIRDQWAGAGR